MNKVIPISTLRSNGLNNMSISRLVRKEMLGNLGFGFYVEKPQTLVFDQDDLSKRINNLLDEFPIVPNRVIFQSISLNFCINQLISSNTYIVEVEKEYLVSAFELLKKELNNVILLKPSKRDKINYWKPNTIYVFELFKRSPVNKDGSITIEKLIVDLIIDEDLSSLYSGQDVDLAIDTLCSKYLINYKTLFAYATRKKKCSYQTKLSFPRNVVGNLPHP